MSLLRSIEIFHGRSETDGLKPFKMAKLGPIVVLAGANGSGKTRLLNAIKSSLDHAKDISRKDAEKRDAYGRYLDSLVAQVSDYREQVDSVSEAVPIAILERAKHALLESERRLAKNLGLRFYPDIRPIDIAVVEMTPAVNLDFS